MENSISTAEDAEVAENSISTAEDAEDAENGFLPPRTQRALRTAIGVQKHPGRRSFTFFLIQTDISTLLLTWPRYRQRQRRLGVSQAEAPLSPQRSDISKTTKRIAALPVAYERVDALCVLRELGGELICSAALPVAV